MFSEIIKEAQEQASRDQVQLSLFIKDLDRGEVFTLNENQVHSSASIIKIPIMMAVLDKGGLDKYLPLKDKNMADFSVVTKIGESSYTVEEYLSWMMIESCNASTNVLIDYVGIDSVNRIFSNLDMKKTVLGRKMMDFEAREAGKDNLATAKDMALLLEAIYLEDYFGSENSKKALEIMKSCRSFNLLPRYYPFPVSFAHKTGGLDEVSHDVGIFFGKKNLLVSALSTSESDRENDPRRTHLLGLLGRRIIEEIK